MAETLAPKAPKASRSPKAEKEVLVPAKPASVPLVGDPVLVELTDKFAGHTGIILDGVVITFVANKATVHSITAAKLKAANIIK